MTSDFTVDLLNQEQFNQKKTKKLVTINLTIELYSKLFTMCNILRPKIIKTITLASFSRMFYLGIQYITVLTS